MSTSAANAPFKLQVPPGQIQPLMDAMVLDALLLVDGLGQILASNLTAREWLGKDPSGTSCVEICGGGCLGCPGAATCGGTEEDWSPERRWGDRLVELTLYPVDVPDPTVEHTGALLVARDVTAHRELEARAERHLSELSMERERVRHILGSLGEALLLLDERGRVEMATPPAEKLFGATQAELATRTLGDLLPGQAWVSGDLERLAAGETHRVEHEAQLEGPPTLELHVTVGAMAPGEGPGGFIAKIRDIGQLKSIDRVRGEFISNVSHELRTPLATLRGVALTMLEDPDMEHVDRTDFLEIIDREAQRLEVLIEDMLAMTRLELGRTRPRTRPVDLKRQVGELRQFFAAQCQECQVRLDVRVPDEAVVVDADPGLLNQIGHNLVGNALRFTPSGGRIRLSLERRGDQGVLAVADNGPGIPEKDQEIVFDRFYRSSHAARIVPGTGLGLAIVKRIADAHGWSTELKSQPDEGTEVWVTMPLSAPE